MPIHTTSIQYIRQQRKKNMTVGSLQTCIWVIHLPLFSLTIQLEIMQWPSLLDRNREFKKLRWQLQRKRHIKIELYVKSLLIIPCWTETEWFSCKGKEWKIYCCELALSSEPQIWKFHVVVWQTMSKHCTKKSAARAARLFFFIQPIKSLICGAVSYTHLTLPTKLEV